MPQASPQSMTPIWIRAHGAAKRAEPSSASATPAKTGSRLLFLLRRRSDHHRWAVTYHLPPSTTGRYRASPSVFSASSPDRRLDPAVSSRPFPGPRLLGLTSSTRRTTHPLPPREARGGCGGAGYALEWRMRRLRMSFRISGDMGSEQS